MHFAHYVDILLYSITLIDPEQRVVALKIIFFYLAVLYFYVSKIMIININCVQHVN